MKARRPSSAVDTCSDLRPDVAAGSSEHVEATRSADSARDAVPSTRGGSRPCHEVTSLRMSRQRSRTRVASLVGRHVHERLPALAVAAAGMAAASGCYDPSPATHEALRVGLSPRRSGRLTAARRRRQRRCPRRRATVAARLPSETARPSRRREAAPTTATSEETASGGTPCTALDRTAHERTSSARSRRSRAPGSRRTARASRGSPPKPTSAATAANGRAKRSAFRARPWSPAESAIAGNDHEEDAEEPDVPSAHSFASGPDDPSANRIRSKADPILTTNLATTATKGAKGDGITHLARARGVPARERRGQEDLRRPVPDREPEDTRRTSRSPSTST